MSSLMSSFAPQSVAWGSAKGLTTVVSRSALQTRVDAAHETAWSSVHVSPAGAPAMVRQRFYPAQLHRLLGPELQQLAATRHQRLTWSGWDRSLPRLYLPIEMLMRLITDAVDNITRAITQPSNVTLRIMSSGNADGQLIMAIEADQWRCDSRFRGSLNASWLQPGDQTHLWQRLARQCDAVGGWLSAVDMPGGGSALQISLPTDQPRALVHSWLARVRQPAAPVHVSLYAIGRSQPESLEELQAANVRLQSLARAEDFIYRACHGRWIWLTTQPGLPAFVKKSAWQSQQMDRWTCAATSSAIIDTTEQIDRRFRQLIGSRIPPVDLHTQSAPRGPITALRPNTHVDSAEPAAHVSHLQSRSQSKVKWRYPI